MKTLKIFLIFAFCFASAYAQAPQQAGVYKNDIMPNYRGYALEVDSSVFKMCAAGDSVDILVYLEVFIKDGKKDFIVPTILQDIYIADTFTSQGKMFVLLQLGPIETQYLALASLQEYKIIKRAKGDTKLYPIQISIMDKIINSAKEENAK